MKPVFTLAALFVLVYVPAKAQNIEINLNYGRNCSPSLHAKHNESVPPENRSVRTFPLYNLKGSYNTDRWQIGGSVGEASISGRYHIDPNTIFDFYWPSGVSDRDMQRVIFEAYNPTYTLKYIQYLVFLNRKVDIGKFTMYGGVSLGGTQMTKIEGRETDVTRGHSGMGLNYSAAVQVGARYAISKHWGVNAELSANYMGLGSRLYVISFPATVGVSYTL